MSFEDKTVLITGASGGIGSETARLFARKGTNVVVNYLSSPEKAEETVRDVEEMGSKAFAFRADVSDPEQVRAMMAAAHERFGGIDVLVNCAAQHPPPMFDLDHPDWELWRRMAQVNIMGVLICSHHATPHLREREGNIVNVVMDWDPGGLGYTLTKTAGTPLTRGLARELAPVRVNAVSPGAEEGGAPPGHRPSHPLPRLRGSLLHHRRDHHGRRGHQAPRIEDHGGRA